MKRAALLAVPLALLCVGTSGAGQDAEVVTDAAEADEFPWPDFLEVMPRPGEYRMSMTFENFQFLGEEQPKDGFNPFAEPPGEEEVELYCLTGEPDLVDWTRDFAGNGCEQTAFNVDGGEFSTTIRCENDFGSGNMTLRMTGSATEEGLDMLMSMQMREPEFGKMSVDMRMSVERIGDCE